MTSKGLFQKYVKELGLEDNSALLTTITGMHRSTVNKYLSSENTSRVDNVPAAAVSLVKLLLLVKTRSPEIYEEWLTLSQVSPETFDKALPDETIYQKILSLNVLKFTKKDV